MGPNRAWNQDCVGEGHQQYTQLDWKKDKPMSQFPESWDIKCGREFC
jgi:hypothetical protein